MTANQLLLSIYAKIVQPALFLLMGVALLVFFWGLVEFIRDAGSDDGRAKGKRHMTWGIIGLFIMVSAFGIISLLNNSIPGTQPPQILQQLQDS